MIQGAAPGSGSWSAGASVREPRLHREQSTEQQGHAVSRADAGMAIGPFGTVKTQSAQSGTRRLGAGRTHGWGRQDDSRTRYRAMVRVCVWRVCVYFGGGGLMQGLCAGFCWVKRGLIINTGF